MIARRKRIECPNFVQGRDVQWHGLRLMSTMVSDVRSSVDYRHVWWYDVSKLGSISTWCDRGLQWGVGGPEREWNGAVLWDGGGGGPLSLCCRRRPRKRVCKILCISSWSRNLLNWSFVIIPIFVSNKTRNSFYGENVIFSAALRDGQLKFW